MSDFEMLSLVLMILSIVVTILISVYKSIQKSNRPSTKGIRLLFCNYIKFGLTNCRVVPFSDLHFSKYLFKCQIQHFKKFFCPWTVSGQFSITFYNNR